MNWCPLYPKLLAEDVSRVILDHLVYITLLQHVFLLFLVRLFCDHIVGYWVDFLEASEILELKLLKFPLLLLHFKLILLLRHANFFLVHI